MFDIGGVWPPLESDWRLADLLHADSLVQHLNLARCVSLTRERDLGAGAVAMAGALHLLQRDQTS
ncbi:hypothetical protein [Synechococcus sp. MIT S9504]|uniref:hypothetical protein n=1 Tax=Synechococcus sp. MIT S9504 TaxID=1801628 RepID=UPI0008344289|nr:hypothetical protein [Synechococcus sp. MIT S9504]